MVIHFRKGASYRPPWPLLYCPSKRGANQGIFSPSFPWRRVLRCPSESSVLEPERHPHLTCRTPPQQPGKPLPNTLGMCILQEGQAQDLLVSDEVLHPLFRGIPSKYSLWSLLDLAVDISWSRDTWKLFCDNQHSLAAEEIHSLGQVLQQQCVIWKRNIYFCSLFWFYKSKKQKGGRDDQSNCIL